MKSGVYRIVNISNGKKYVGSSVNVQERIKAHKRALRRGDHHSPHLQNAWNKYGSECFNFEYLEPCEPENCVSREQFFIDSMNPEYNICSVAGSVLGRKHSDETKRKIGNSRLGKKHSQESIKRMTGKKFSQERKEKIRKAHLGRSLSQDHVRKISESNRGKKRNKDCPSRRYGFSNSSTIRLTYTVENREGCRITGIPIEIRRLTGILPGNMSSLLSGRRKSSLGWRLVKEENSDKVLNTPD